MCYSFIIKILKRKRKRKLPIEDWVVEQVQSRRRTRWEQRPIADRRAHSQEGMWLGSQRDRVLGDREDVERVWGQAGQRFLSHQRTTEISWFLETRVAWSDLHFEKVTLTIVWRTGLEGCQNQWGKQYRKNKRKGIGLGLERANILSLGKEGWGYGHPFTRRMGGRR